MTTAQKAGVDSSNASTGAPPTPPPTQPYAGPTPNGTPTPPPKPVSIISTQSAANDLQQGQSKLNNISPSSNPTAPPPASPSVSSTSTSTTTPSTSSTAATQPDYIKLVNPATGQEQTYNNPDINKQTIQGLLAGGWSVAESQLSTPFDFGTTPGAPVKSQAQQDLDTAQAAIDQTNAKYEAMKNTDDPATSALISSIQGKYGALISQMQEQNQRQDQSYSTLGYRIGGQYGAGGNSIKDLVSLSASNGVQRIAALQAQEDQEVANARIAEQNQKWTEFSDTMNRLDAVRKDKQDALNAENKTAADLLQKQQTEAQSAAISNSVATLLKQGVSDPKDILTQLNSGGFKVDAATLKSNMDALVTNNPALQAAAEIAKTAAANGAPTDVLQKIASSTNLSDAYGAAGDFLAAGTGIVGEYQYYVRQAKAAGQTPLDFSAYQNIDANRKKSIAVTNNYTGTGAPGTLSKAGQAWVTAVQNGNATMTNVPAAYKDEVALGLANTDQTSYSPLAASRFSTASNRIVANFINLPQYQLTANGLPYLQRIDAAMQNPGSVSDQDLLDSLTKLNTAGNAISDAQVKLITDGRSWSDAASVFANKLGNGGVLSTNQRQQIDAIAQAVYANYKKGYQPVYDKATSQLKAAGVPEAFWTIPDLNNLSAQAQSSTGDAIVQQQQNDPLNLGVSESGGSDNNPLGI